MVLVDTPLWSLALRRRAIDLNPAEHRLSRSLNALVRQHRVQMLGAIRQEVLSGIREEAQFRKIRDYLRDFPDVDQDLGDYEEAAHMSNQCRRSGIVGSAVDMLICAVALHRGWEIFSTDQDFIQYGRVLPLQMFQDAT
jgi:predicted nucleic acid-binding protein